MLQQPDGIEEQLKLALERCDRMALALTDELAVGELAVDVGFVAGACGQGGDHLEHVRWARRCAHRSNEHLAVELIHSFVDLDVPAVQLSDNHDTTFHALKRSSWSDKIVGNSH